MAASEVGHEAMLAVEIPLVVLALSTVVLRVYARLGIKRKLALDDILIICAIICALVRTIISCMSGGTTFRFDPNGPDTKAQVPYYRHILERRIAYILAILFTRLSILSYYLRIFPPQITTLRTLTIFLIILAIAHFLEVLTVLAVLCRTIGRLWTAHWPAFNEGQCFSSPIYSYSAAVGDAIVDTLIFALPIPYVWRLSKLRIRQRLGLVVIFGLGFLVCVVALCEIPFIRRRVDNMNYFGMAINLLVAIQISLAIIAASLPDLRALVARSFPNFSPLHHRSLNTRVSRIQDWERESLPGRLMGTLVERNTESMSTLASVVSRERIGLPRRQTAEVMNALSRALSKDIVALPRRPSH